MTARPCARLLARTVVGALLLGAAVVGTPAVAQARGGGAETEPVPVVPSLDECADVVAKNSGQVAHHRKAPSMSFTVTSCSVFDELLYPEVTDSARSILDPAVDCSVTPWPGALPPFLLVKAGSTVGLTLDSFHGACALERHQVTLRLYDIDHNLVDTAAFFWSDATKA